MFSDKISQKFDTGVSIPATPQNPDEEQAPAHLSDIREREREDDTNQSKGDDKGGVAQHGRGGQGGGARPDGEPGGSAALDE